MALVLLLKRNDVIFIGGKKLEIKKTYSDNSVLIKDEYDQELKLFDGAYSEIYPNVKVAVGEPTMSDSSVRLVIEAPREIPIVRQDLVD